MASVRKTTRIRRREFKHGFAKTLRASATDAERLLWSLLRDSRLPVRFRRQQPVGPYIADFFCPTAKLIIELDGGQHGVVAAVLHDEARTRFLNSRGYQVIRFSNHEVFRNPHLVLEAILRATDKANARCAFDPSPKIPAGFSTLPQGEGES